MALERYFTQEGIIRSKVESFLKNELNRAGYSGINIQKTPLSTRVILLVEKPPLVIGKRGKRINKLTEILSQKFGLDNPSIDVQKIEEPLLDPNIIARRIAVALERGINRRRVVYRALRSVMGANALGIEIVLSGKIVGKGGRSRSEKYSQGYMKKSGNSVNLVRKGATQASLKAGVIGVTVNIVPPDAVFPDQIYLKSDIAAKKPPEAKPSEQPQQEGKPPEGSSRKEKTDSAKREKAPRRRTKKEELPSGEKLTLPQGDTKLIAEAPAVLVEASVKQKSSEEKS